jgi:hypothetical protein
MAQSPAGPTPIGVKQLQALLIKSKADPTFRDSLHNSPDATLKAEGLRPDAHWVHFFSELQASDFEARMNTQIMILDGEGEGEG